MATTLATNPTSPSQAFGNIPALLPPPGVTSNFINPPSLGSELLIASIVCLTFMALFAGMRFYTKIAIKNRLGWDDYLCIPAIIGAVGFTATSISLLGEGVGPHQWNVPITAFLNDDLLRKFIVVDLIYSPSILMAKLSLLVLYLEIFRPNVALRYLIYCGIVFVSLFYTSTLIAFAVLSIPKPGQSLLASILSPDTAKDIPLGEAQGAINILSDFYILCLPIPGVWILQLPLKKRLGFIAIFMTGLLACFSSVIGLYYRTKVNRSTDVTWDLVPTLLWVVVELNVGVICGCMPSLAAFVRHVGPLLSSYRSSNMSKEQTPVFKKWLPSFGSSNRSATKGFRVTLGSKVNGRGNFMGSMSSLTRGGNWIELNNERSPIFDLDNGQAGDARRSQHNATTPISSSAPSWKNLTRPESTHARDARHDLEVGMVM